MEMLGGNLKWSGWQETALHKPSPAFKKDRCKPSGFIAPGEPQRAVVQLSHNFITRAPLVLPFPPSRVAACYIDRSKTLLIPHCTENTEKIEPVGLGGKRVLGNKSAQSCCKDKTHCNWWCEEVAQHRDLHVKQIPTSFLLSDLQPFNFHN